MDVRRVASNPWDFTLYESDIGSRILKVIFSEGEYKIDIERFFLIDSTKESTDVEKLKELTAQIRADYPNVSLQQVDKSSLTILK